MRDNFQYLERTELSDKIAKIEEVPLMLVTAPMGYGKSTIVREYLQKHNKTYLWIALGQNPVQEEWLWNRIAQEYDRIKKSLSQLMLQSGIPYSCDWEMTEENLLTAMRQEFTQQEIYLVIDDYQSCNGDKLNRFLTRLAYEDIQGSHTILISRSHIDLPLMELQVKGYCAFISQEDLIMSPEETAHLFRMNGIELEDRQLKKVYAYTDGWIAASRLLLLDYQKTGNLQSTGSVYLLLKESVYAKLTEEQKYLLYPFSCFAELSIEELSAICEIPVTRAVMDTLIEKTGLIHQNTQNHKYSIHALLHTTLMNEACCNNAEIYRRYALLQKKNGNVIGALVNFQKSGDREEILQILDGEKRFEIMDQIPDFLWKFFRECKNKEELFQHPIAVFSYIYTMLMSADETVLWEGRRFYSYVKEHYETKENPSQSDKDLLGELLIINTLIVFNDLQAANAVLDQAWELRKGKPSHIFTKRIYSYGVPNTLHLYHREPGKLLEETEGEIEISRQYMRLIYSTQSSLEKLIRAEYALETGQIDQACTEVIEALKKAEFRNQTGVAISGYMVLFRCLIYHGNKKGLEESVKQCMQFVQNAKRNITTVLAEYELLLGYIFAILGHLDRIPVWLRKGQFDNCNLIMRGSRSAGIVYGIYLCRKKSWERLGVNAEEMMLPFSETRHVFAEIFANIFYAIAQWNEKECDAAREYLQKAIDLAAPDRIVTPFVELSDELQPIWQSTQKDCSFLRQIEDLRQVWKQGLRAFRSDEHKEPIFTPREAEILELLAEGCRNGEIGNRMHIAQVTVEKNLTNIYRKIGVSNRTGAAKWYNDNYKSIP